MIFKYDNRRRKDNFIYSGKSASMKDITSHMQSGKISSTCKSIFENVQCNHFAGD